MNLKGKSFLKLLDFTPEEINYLIDYAAELKAQKKNGVLVLTAKDKVRLLPALNIPFETLKKAIDIICQAMA